MRRLTLAFALLLGLALAAPSGAQAQGVEVGARIGVPVGNYSDAAEDGGFDSSVFIGGDVRISAPALPFEIGATGDYYLTSPPDGVSSSVFLLGANALFPLGVDNEVFTPYLGAGPRLAFSTIEGGNVEESATNFGLGALFGAKFGFGGVTPYVEAGYSYILSGKIDNEQTSLNEIERTGASAFNIQAGLLFGF